MKKKIISVLLSALAVSALLLTSCGKKTVNVQVIDGEGNTVCDENVIIGEENENSILGVTTFGLDCFEAALTQADIDYYVDKADSDAFVITNVADISCDKENGFRYYVKAKGKKEYEDKTGLTAQHDYVESGDSIMFKYESLATNEEK